MVAPQSAPSSCTPGCILEDDHDDCWTRQDVIEEAQLRRWEDDCQDRGWTTRRR